MQTLSQLSSQFMVKKQPLSAKQKLVIKVYCCFPNLYNEAFIILKKRNKHENTNVIEYINDCYAALKLLIIKKEKHHVRNI